MSTTALPQPSLIRVVLGCAVAAALFPMLFGVFEVGHLSACQCGTPNPYTSTALAFLSKYAIPTVLVATMVFGSVLYKTGVLNRMSLGFCVALSAGLLGLAIPSTAVPISIFTKYFVADLAGAGFLVGFVAHRIVFFRRAVT